MAKKTKFNSVEEYLRFKMNQSGTVHLEYVNNILDQYNTPRFPSVKGYHFVSEKQLWGNRNHNYKMWI